MDGNGRWARQRQLDRTEGHRKGADSVEAALRATRRHGIRHLTLFAFSSENWNRPREEVSFLMEMLLSYLRQQKDTLIREGIRFETIGDLGALPAALQDELNDAKQATADFTQHQLNLAINYGSRNEILEAVKSLALDIAAGRVSPEGLDWPLFSNYLQTRDIPDPDLIIRTSGEWRLSNFLLAQSAYTEFFFSPVLWPDFSEADFDAAIADYRKRERRFGHTHAPKPRPSSPPQNPDYVQTNC